MIVGVARDHGYGGGGVTFGALFRSDSGALARVNPFSFAVLSFRAVTIFPYGSAMEWQATYAAPKRLPSKVFLPLRYRDTRASGSNPLG